MKEEPKVEAANVAKAAEWNAAISPRLVALRAWFSGPEWKEGISVYLNKVLMHRREHLEKIDNDARDDQFIKGQIASLKEILAIPLFIEKQIAQAEQNKKTAPSGDAGY
jgi:hypothetical protein